STLEWRRRTDSCGSRCPREHQVTLQPFLVQTEILTAPKPPPVRPLSCLGSLRFDESTVRSSKSRHRGIWQALADCPTVPSSSDAVCLQYGAPKLEPPPCSL